MLDVMNVDTSGILALEEIHKKLCSYGIQVCVSSACQNYLSNLKDN